MKVFGGTCPMCCGDLDAVDSRPDGAAVCLFCHYHTRGGEAGGGYRLPASPHPASITVKRATPITIANI